MYLSVLIPMYNEKENLERGVLAKVENFMRRQKFAWEVIISDDGSTDNSLELAKNLVKDRPSFRVLTNGHGGKPHALWQAIKKAKGEYVLFDDMDQSTPIDELKKLLPFFRDHQVIIGSRGIQRRDYPLLRRLGSAVFLVARKLMLLGQINDTQCGFKVL
jgi:dolichyl-phosphate beta-glucosyltransferase